MIPIVAFAYFTFYMLNLVMLDVSYVKCSVTREIRPLVFRSGFAQTRLAPVLKTIFHQWPYHILVASLTLMALF